jgi:hypothetical protein
MACGNVNRTNNAGKEITLAVPAQQVYSLNLHPDIVLEWGRTVYRNFKQKKLNRRNIKNRRMANQQFNHEGKWYQLSIDLVKGIIRAVKFCTKVARQKISASDGYRKGYHPSAIATA